MTLRDKIADEVSSGGCNHPIVDNRKYAIADAILNLPELKELQEKLDLIMEGLVVDNRPANPEEVREMIEESFKEYWNHEIECGIFLKSGSVLRLKNGV